MSSATPGRKERRRLCSSLAAAFSLCGGIVAAPAFAQAPSGPPDTQVGQPVAGPPPPTSRPARREPRFSLWARAEESYEVNPLLQQDGDDLNSFVDNLTAGLGYTFRGPRGDLSFNADGGRLNYHDLPDLSRWTYGGSVRGLYNISPRSSFSVRERYTVSAQNPAAVLESSGLPVSLVNSRTNSADANLHLGVTRRTNLDLGVRHEKITFDENASLPGIGPLIAGNVLTADARLSRRIGNEDSLGLGYSYAFNLASGTGADVQSAYLSWAGRLGRRVGAALTGGASRLSAREVTGVPGVPPDPTAPPIVPIAAKWRPSGSAALSAEFRHGSLNAGYSHSVGQAFGFGVERVADFASLSADRRFGRKTTMNINGSYGRTRDVTGSDLNSFDTVAAAAAFRYLLSRRFELNAGYSYGRVKPADTLIEPFKTGRAFFALAYGKLRE